MKKRSNVLSVISYITWLGWAIAFFCRNKKDALVRRHLNQALILNIIETASRLVSRLGGPFHFLALAADIAVAVLSITGVVRALRLSDKPLPFIGNITLID